MMKGGGEARKKRAGKKAEIQSRRCFFPSTVEKNLRGRKMAKKREGETPFRDIFPQYFRLKSISVLIVMDNTLHGRHKAKGDG